MNATCRRRAPLFSFLILLCLIAWPEATRGDLPGRWVSLGPTKILGGNTAVSGGDVTGRVTTIAIDFADPKLMYVGARGSGVWRTRDGGFKWEPVTDGLPTQTVLALATAPSQPDRVYLSTPKGTFRSDDAGSTWNHVSALDLHGRGWDGGAMLVDPSDADRVLLTACEGTSASVYRTTDGGSTWQAVLSQGCATGLVRDPSDANRFLAAVSYPTPTAHLYETLDGGDTWHERPGCDAAPLPVPPTNTIVKIAQSGDVRFASYYVGGTYRLFRASGKTCGGKDTDADFVWEMIWDAPPADAPNFWSALHVDPQDPTRLAATGSIVYVSTDGGFSFTVPNPNPHADHHAWVYDRQDSRVIFAGTDGGLYRSDDSGSAGHWQFMGAGIVNSEMFDLADAGTLPRVLFAGSQDNGAYEYPGTGTIWTSKVLGDSEMVEIDATDANVRYAASQQQNHIWMTTDNYATGPVHIGGNLPASGCPPWSTEYPADPTSQFLIHPTQPSTLLVACGPLWVGWPFTPLFTPAPPNGGTKTVAVDASVSLYWSGTTGGRILAGSGGSNWQTVFTHPLEFGAASAAIELDPADPTVLFAAFRTYLGMGGRIYRLKRFDAKPTTVAAADITSNLPSGIHFKSLAVDRLQPHTIYAGTDFGVYRGRSTDGGVSWFWSPYKNGMPEAVDVRALEVHPVTGMLRAGTFGRGAYEVNTDWPIGGLTSAEGHITLLRAQDVGQTYGPPGDVIDADVIVQLDSMPGYAFGFQLRPDAQGAARTGMLKRLRDAMRLDTLVRLEYIRTGFRNGVLTRVYNVP